MSVSLGASGAGRRVVAFYLPQFHPIPENDEWWQPGFTEWTNVTQARPFFPGHVQPRLPRDLGFYDLRSEEVREAQAELARASGVDGFCYYHYWFNGTRLLERPLDEVVRLGRPDFPFMVCWANEHWTRLWNGGDREVLIKQDYSIEDDRAHIRALLPILGDDRYITIDGRKVLAIYRVDQLPDPAATADLWRQAAQAEGLDLYLCSVESHVVGGDLPPGFDASVWFLPHPSVLGARQGPGKVGRGVRKLVRRSSPLSRNLVYSYDSLVDNALAQPFPDHLRFPSVSPDWDNSSRRSTGGARILVGSTPEKYGEWLYQTLVRFTPPTPEENLVFVNAWNEWAEAAYLEPDQRWGRAYLDAHADAVRRAKAELVS